MIAEAFHAGERAMQERAGVRERMAQVGGQVIRTFMPEQHRSFFRQLPFVVVGSLDAVRQPWASLLAGTPGFVESPSPTALRFNTLPTAHSPLAAALRPGASLGLLGIEPHTRRRNRANGVVTETDARGFDVDVEQSFGNCPKYIQAREAIHVDMAEFPSSVRSNALDTRTAGLVAAADTFFIATAHPLAGDRSDRAHGVDVSHRGGKPGFVRVEDSRTLLVPDFSGNFFFNTLGNLAANPRAGLLFPDFAIGALLHLAVEAEIIWEGADLAGFAGAQRLLRLHTRESLLVDNAMPLRWGAAALSPNLVPTGHW
jgi:predicted pyridoxine 5'-phosphate oxidase superfamily flavin-nucleotide-binding protein